MPIHANTSQFIVMALAAVALAGCEARSNPASQSQVNQVPEVSVTTVRHTNVPVTIDLPGRTSPYLIAQVRARVDGIVQKREYQEGADVKANQPLFRIDPAPYRAALDSAEASLQKAQANLANTTAQLERYKVLVGGNAVSKQVYDNAVATQRQAAADVAVATAAARTARINLGYTSVVSPIAGLSGISQVTQGAYVQGSAATLLTTIQQIDPIYVDLQQSSTEGLRLRRDVASGRLKLDGPGQARVTLMLEDGTPYSQTGKLEFSGATVDPGTGSVTLRAAFPNPGHVLLPGMFVHAQVEQGTNDNALLVPVAAVTHNPQGQATVLVVGPDNKIMQRVIQTRNIVANSWVVEGGLKDGEQVVVSGGQKARPGMLVKAVQAQTPTTLAAESGSQQTDALDKAVTASKAK